MRIVVFGATGGTGRVVLAEAMRRGHRVRAFARGTTELPTPDVARGNILDRPAVFRAIAGQDVVVTALGMAARATPSAADTTMSTATRHIVDAMQEQGVKRLLLVSAFGVGESVAQAGFPFRQLILPRLRNHYADKERQEAVVRASSLQWTIVRPCHLVDGATCGPVRVVERRTRFYESIPRVDVGAFLLDHIADARLDGRAVTIASDAFTWRV